VFSVFIVLYVSKFAGLLPTSFLDCALMRLYKGGLSFGVWLVVIVT